ncbi:MAG: ATP-dependent metallopeptidase FtsH/Yme1/Tma family protein, partial [Bacillota bacterium]
MTPKHLRFIISAAVAFLLFSLFSQQFHLGGQGAATPVAYSDFLSQVKAKSIREAVIEGT